MTVIYAKPGTHAGQWLRVKFLRRLPRVGSVVHAKSSDRHGNVHAGSKWARWLVEGVRPCGKVDLFVLVAM